MAINVNVFFMLSFCFRSAKVSQSLWFTIPTLRIDENDFRFAQKMVMRIWMLFVFGIIHFEAVAQNTPPRPKLVVGLVVDQMRWDFLYRYADKYSATGFNRLLREGYNCQNTHINYSPSYTACGHTCVYTGSLPSVHGIAGNNWYDYKDARYVYCTEDSSYKTVGSTSKAGQMSPKRMVASTITDELRLATNFKSKCIGIALKDRSSILPAGHAGNAAYFYDPNVGKWITSSYYGISDLPVWVNQFNDFKLPEKYMQQNWNTLKPIVEYYESDEDDVPYESALPGEASPVFEHKTSQLSPQYKVLLATPYGNSFTLKFAEGAILNEQLGQGNQTDFLAVSLSSTDYVGHSFGPNSIEVQDCYMRLDQDLSDFFAFLDKTVGAGNYLFFLTADHGVAHIPDYLKKKKMEGGVFNSATLVKQLNDSLKAVYGLDTLIVAYENMHLYFNNKLITEKKLNEQNIKSLVKHWTLQYKGVANVYDLSNLSNENIEHSLKEKISNSVFAGRAGNMYVMFNPNWFEDMPKGTTHGTIYPYDTHIPLIWMGWKVKPGTDYSAINMTDIAPTLAGMLHIQEPNGCVGKPITELMKNINNH